MDRNQLGPPHVIDYVLIYSRCDESAASDVNDELRAAGLDGRLYDDEAPFGSLYTLDDAYETQRQLMTYSVVRLVLVSDNDMDDDGDFLLAKNEALTQRQTSDGDVLCPVWLTATASKNMTSPKTLFGLKVLRGFRAQDASFAEQVRKWLHMTMLQPVRERKARQMTDEGFARRVRVEQKTNVDGQTIVNHMIIEVNDGDVIVANTPSQTEATRTAAGSTRAPADNTRHALAESTRHAPADSTRHAPADNTPQPTTNTTDVPRCFAVPDKFWKVHFADRDTWSDPVVSSASNGSWSMPSQESFPESSSVSSFEQLPP